MSDLFEYTIHDLIACAEREVVMRKRVYSLRIERRTMTHEKAEWEIGAMERIAEILKEIKANDKEDIYDRITKLQNSGKHK